jgi:phosphoribosylaminoimidazolecarboxamide formyltransferase/IMP cyclohydrolase
MPDNPTQFAVHADAGPERQRIRRAILSVWDKTGLIPLAQALAARGVEIISTGGTAAALKAERIPVKEVADVTGFPEMMDGRVKSLHPRIHGGLLALRGNPSHAAAMRAHNIPPIDLLVCNLYPFEMYVAKGASYADCIEVIDVGGPAMVRSAAKNHAHVAVVTGVKDYPALMQALDDGGTTFRFRHRLAIAAYAHTAGYDAAVSAWLARTIDESAPDGRAFAGTLAQTLRYGENPHQGAAFYRDSSGRPGVATATQLQGKELSWNNINDTDAAYELVAELGSASPACVIVKHANPCGVATGATLADAFLRARDCDRTSAFGGIIAFNGRVGVAEAEVIGDMFAEVVIAPSIDDAALAVFAAKKNLRVLATGALPDPAAPGLSFRQVAGGFLVQDRDAGRLDPSALKVVTQRAPTDAELADLTFAWTIAKHVRSNAIVFARGGATVGIGAGQMSRVDSTRIAVRKAQDMAEVLGLPASPAVGAAVASDAFFPFADGIEELARGGATAVIQPGGSVRDAEIIAAADAAGLAMVFTGMRHFRH